MPRWNWATLEVSIISSPSVGVSTAPVDGRCLRAWRHGSTSFVDAAQPHKKAMGADRSAARAHANATNVTLHAIGFLEGADLALGFLAGDAVARLDFADQLVTTALDFEQVVVGQLAPLLLHRAFCLRPAA